MKDQITRSFSQPERENPPFHERWRGPDRGLITCWEVGREMRRKEPELAERARNGELPPMGWKGGVEKETKQKIKYGTLNYLAQWQGIRGEDLEIVLSEETVLICTRTGMKVIFTGDETKYANA